MACAIVAVAQPGCGGESEGSASCGGEPCGGDVVGTWHVERLCVDEGVFGDFFDEPECAGALRDVSVRASGTYEFAADGTGAASVRVAFDATLAMNSACLTALGSQVPDSQACSALDDAFNQQAESDPTGPFESASCSFSGGACRCRMTGREETYESGGPYEVSGETLVNEEGEATPYCVAGDTLRLFEDRGTIILRR